MRFTITLSRVDYAALLGLVNPNAGRVAGLLSQARLGTLTVQAIQTGEAYLSRRLEGLAAEKGLRLSLDGLEAQNLGDQRLQLTVRIRELDLESVAELALPAAQKALWASPRLAFFGDALGREPDAYTHGVQTIWDALSAPERERLLSQALKSYQGPLLQKLNAIVRDKGWELEVEALQLGEPEAL